nr:M48 family metalloprotease [Nafulsella turpanensis]
MLLSKKQEIAMGAQSDPEIVSFFGLYDDEELQRFIDVKGEQMAAISHRPELDYDFKILDSPVVNAFAVPGGYVYFTRGILAHFNNEAEFAGVLGHEIGHIAARHSAKQYSKAMLAQVGLVAGMVISPEFAQFADVANQGVSLLFLKFGRDAEEQSDKLGVECSTKIGYDAEEMAEFFLTLNRMRTESDVEAVPTFLSTHPDPANRYEAVQKLAAIWQEKLNVTDLEENRNQYLRMIDGMVYGEDPKQGFVEENVFYHPVLKFKFPIPSDFTFQNTPQQVQMAHTSGKAIAMFTLAQGESLEAAAQAALQNYQLQPLESRQLTVSGLPAVAVVAERQQEGQQPLQVLLYLISYEGNIYQFMGISSANEFNSFARYFTDIFNNFAPLTDPDKLNRQPERIRIKTVQRAGTLAEALRRHGVPEERMEELALLNGMELTDPVEAGLLFKVIER